MLVLLLLFLLLRQRREEAEQGEGAGQPPEAEEEELGRICHKGPALPQGELGRDFFAWAGAGIFRPAWAGLATRGAGPGFWLAGNARPQTPHHTTFLLQEKTRQLF